MIVHTCISKKYVLSLEEEGALKRASGILDNLYAYSEEDGKWEKDFQEARNNLDYLLNELEFNGKYSYWSEEVAEDKMIEQE